MGGGGRYPYPKHVWSPAGGWWVQPHNWKTNTAVVFGGIALISAFAFTVSAEKEYRTIAPNRKILSMRWTKQYNESKSQP